MERFNFDEIQAKAILDIKLERLTALERDKILLERDNLLKEIEYFRAVLGSDRMVLGSSARNLKICSASTKIEKDQNNRIRRYYQRRRTHNRRRVTVMLTRLVY